MCHRMRTFCASFLLVISAIFYAGSGAIAQDAAWQISKMSGDVSVITPGAQQAALTDGAVLKPGDSIHTGQTGRALLTRGEESILVSPNSFISLPTAQIDGMSTTINQQEGSILLDVEKRNVKHFEVVTPYLAAVVKGTRFRVTLNKNNANVDVLRGQVEVTDFKSGQIATVLPGQTASVSPQDQGGLSLTGSGTLRPIQQGVPSQSTVPPLTVIDEHRAATGGAADGRKVTVIDEHRATAGSAANGPKVTVATKDSVRQAGTANRPKVREALALGASASVPVLSNTSAANHSDSDRLWSKLDEDNFRIWWNSFANRWWDRSDDLTFNLAVPLCVGFAVSVGVTANRQKKRDKKKQPPRPSDG